MVNERTRFQIPVYWQLIGTYLVIVLIVLAILSPALRKTIALSKESYLVEAKQNLNNSMTLLSNTYREIYQLPVKLSDISYFNRLRSTSGTPVDMGSYGSIHMTSKALAKHFVTLEYVDDIFLYFPKNGLTFSKYRVFETLEDYLGFDLVFSQVPGFEVASWIKGSRDISQVYPITQARLHLGDLNNYLLITMKRQASSLIVGSLISESNIQSVFGIDHLPRDSFLLISDIEGQPLYAYQYEGTFPPLGNGEVQLNEVRYTVLSERILLPAIQVQLGIPDAYFTKLQQPVISMITRILAIAGILALLLSALFALLNAMPVKKLLKISGGKPEKGQLSHIREFSDIGKTLRESSEKIEHLKDNALRMEGALKSSILTQMLYGTIGNNEQSLPSRLLPQTSAPYRVAVYTFDYDKTESSEVMGYLIHQELENHAGQDSFVFGQISPYKTAVFFSENPGNLNLVQGLHLSLNQVDDALLVTCGISEALIGKKNVGVAYRHALFCLSQAEAGSLVFYEPQDTVQAQAIGLYGMQRLYNYIVACDCEQASKLLRNILLAVGINSHEGAQAFYLVRFVLESVIGDGGLEMADFHLPDYTAAMPEEELFAGLQAQMSLLITKLKEKKDAKKGQVQARMLAYIDERLSDPDLYADSLAEVFGVSRNMVYRMVRERTGKSLNEYIEQSRMRLAIDLLESSQTSIEEIASQCGYNSTNTFYKVFKKNFGDSPSSFRK